jgi:hypothetical protein
MSRYLDVEIDIAVERVAKWHAAAWKWPLERAFERANGSDRKNMEHAYYYFNRPYFI